MRRPLRLDWSESRVGAVVMFAGMAFHILKWCWEDKPLSEHCAAEGEVVGLSLIHISEPTRQS